MPHELAGGDTDAPVVIGTELPSSGEVLLNLGGDVPPGFAAFGRIAEIIDGDTERRRQGRERFRYYRDQGIAPETHNLDDRPDA